MLPVRIILFIGMIGLSLPGWTQVSSLESNGDPSVEDKTIAQLIQINQRAKKNVLLFFKTSQQLNLEVSSSTAINQGRIRIIKDGTPVYSSKFDTTSLLRFLRINDQYKILEIEENYYEIELENNQSAWVQKEKVTFAGGALSSLTSLPELSNAEAGHLQMLERLLINLADLEITFTELLKKLDNSNPEIQRLQIDFQRNLQNVRQYYQDHFSEFSNPEVASQSIDKRLSGLVSLSRGTSRFSDEYADGSEVIHKGAVGDIVLGLRYQIDNSSSATLDVNSNREILGTPYRNRIFQLGYQKDFDKTRLNTRAGLNNYLDEFSDINTYNRIHFSTQVDHQLNDKSTIRADYQFVNNSFQQTTNPNFTQHFININSSHRVNNHKTLRFSLRSNFSASKRADLNSALLLPSISLTSKKGKVTTQSTMQLESFSFPDLPLRNSRRISLAVNKRQRKLPGEAQRKKLLIAFTGFPENNNLDHVRLSFIRSKSAFFNDRRRTNFGLTSKFFINNTAASYADLTWDKSKTKKLYTQLTTFARVWYPKSSFNILAEADYRCGFIFGQFKAGPTLSVRALMGSDSLTFATDGNNYRLGAFVEGQTLIADLVQLSMNAGLNYGSVYSEDFTVDDAGLITPGVIRTRHPTTIRLSSRLNYQLLNLFDLFANIDYYKIDRDYSPDQNFDTVQQSNRFSIKIGFTYRYN